MAGIEVLSRTQKIIINPRQALSVKNTTLNAHVKVVDAGPMGPPGPQGPAASSASAMGVVDPPQLVWAMQHNLEFFPAGVKFHDLEGENELEPEEVRYLNNNRILAIWPEPMAGTWMIS